MFFAKIIYGGEVLGKTGVIETRPFATYPVLVLPKSLGWQLNISLKDL